MYQRRRARLLLAVLTLGALFFITLDVRAGDDGMLSNARAGATTVFQPVQDGFAFLIRPFSTAASSVSDIFGVRTDNAELRRQVDVLAERRQIIADLDRENSELRRLLGMAERGDYTTVVARAVSLSPSTFEWTITIDVGFNDGVARDMAVVSGDGLVGRIVQVTPTSSRVLLAIDPNFFAAARTARTGETGLIEGRGSDPMILRPLDPQADIGPGDEIVTSSYQGGVFPAGIPVGVVDDAGDSSARLTREVTVFPYVDFTRLHHVLVILSAPVEPVPPLTGTPDVTFDAPQVPRFLDELVNETDDDSDGDDSDEGDDVDDGTQGTP